MKPSKLFPLSLVLLIFCGCTVKAVGDPNRPITINANVVVDIRGLKQTAESIEDQIAKGSPNLAKPPARGRPTRPG